MEKRMNMNDEGTFMGIAVSLFFVRKMACDNGVSLDSYNHLRVVVRSFQGIRFGICFVLGATWPCPRGWEAQNLYSMNMEHHNKQTLQVIGSGKRTEQLW